MDHKGLHTQVAVVDFFDTTIVVCSSEIMQWPSIISPGFKEVLSK